MNYSIFCCYRHHTVTLAKQEIKNPLTVLEAIYKRRNLESFKENLWEFFWTVYRDELWRKKGGGYFYSIYMDLIKLIDALWLINTQHPELCTKPYNNQLPTQTSKLMSIFNQVFEERKKNNQNKIKSNQKNSPIDFYDSHSFSLIRHHLYNYLQIGLNISYMDGNKYDYFDLWGYDVADDFINIERLLEEGQNIRSKNKTAAENPAHKKQLKFASDTDHPSTLNDESIEDPKTYITDLYQYQLNFEQIAECIKIWEKSLYEKNFWLNADSPGNILFFAECLKKLIDCIWLLIQKDQINAGTAKRKLTNSKKKFYQSLNEQEFNQPFFVLKSFFEHKKMHQWREQLSEWTHISLSYTDTIKPEDIAKTSTNINYLVKFIEASHLLIY